MDSVKTSLKGRIKALMSRNKQLSTEIETCAPDSTKQPLKQEKENNNNELRKIRTQEFEQEQINEDTNFIKQCYLYLRRLGLTKSQHQFSEQFLNKSQHYLSMIICENRAPAVNALYNLVQNLNQAYDYYLEYEDKPSINRQLQQLIEKGNNIITRKILKLYEVNNANINRFSAII